MTTPEQQIQEWTEINAPYGKELGYPNCCIKEFCDQPPALLKIATKADKIRYKAACVNGQFKGFIPCLSHAKQINKGEITLDALIHNRNPDFKPFPFEGHYEKDITELDEDELVNHIKYEKMKTKHDTVWLMTGGVLVGFGIAKIFKVSALSSVCFSLAAITLGMMYKSKL